jgi:hypothetical protein
MNAISRRDMVKVSGVAIGAPLFGLLSSSMGKAKAAAVVAGVAAAPAYNAELGNWCADQAAATSAKISSGTASSADILHLSRVTRVLGRHTQLLGVDPIISLMAKNIDTSQNDVADSQISASTTAAVLRFRRKREPSLTSEQIIRSQVVPKGSLSLAKRAMVENGFSARFLDSADALAHLAKFGTGAIAPQQVRSRRSTGYGDGVIWQPATYFVSSQTGLDLARRSEAPQFIEVGFGDVCKNLGCKVLNNDVIVALISTALGAAMEAVVVSLAGGVCSSTQLAIAVGAVLSAGAALLAEPIAIGACAAAVAAAAVLTAGENLAISAIVAAALKALKDELGCPPGD